MPNEMDVAVKALVTEAIFKGLDEKKREELIKTAIASLLKEEKSHWSSGGTTPLQTAFDIAASDAAREIIREHFTKDESFRTKVAGVVKDALDRVWAGEKREEMVNAMGDVIIEAMRFKRRD